MLINTRFEYPPIERETLDDGSRFYRCPVSGNAVPSVTTVLDKTGDKSGLEQWRAFVGETKAERERLHATNLGTLMHEHLENYVRGLPRPRGNNFIRQQAERMADVIIAQGLTKVDEVWAIEVPLYFPALFAGTTDLIGVYQGRPAIMDYKNSKKMKTRDQIGNYACQLAAYAMAHNEVHGTDIQTGVVFMADRENRFQDFVFTGDEFEQAKADFLLRLEQYMDGGSAK